ncbi:MAG: methionyl-tRNA formyltransferase [Actinobacteria bacterium]|nr:methionyl-tRNA formyltransferase [Actinomycetota bacterium]
MRIVFMGTPDFAVPSLRALVQHHDVLAVYTPPDAASGRGKELHPCAVKVAALELGIPVHTPADFRSEDEITYLSSLAPDLIVVAAYGVILPHNVLEIPIYGCINVHGSILPRWRGAAPIQRAILAGDEVAGVCIMRMEEGLDTGDYCLCETTPIAGKSTDDLTAELALLGADTLLKALEDLESETVVWTEQDDSQASYAEKISKRDVLLSPELDADKNVLRVRASSTTAPSRAVVCGKIVTVLAAHVAQEAEISDTLDPGEVSLSEARITLGCADGAFVIDEVKPAGKNSMTAQAWIRGLQNAPLEWSELA